MKSLTHKRSHRFYKWCRQALTKGFELLYDDRQEDSDLPEARQGQLANMLGITGKKNKTDTLIAHLTPGEIVVPLNHQTEEVMHLLKQQMGSELATYTVGSGQEQINPESGLPAFATQWGPWTNFVTSGTYDVKVKERVTIQEVSNTLGGDGLEYHMEWFKLNEDGSVNPNFGVERSQPYGGLFTPNSVKIKEYRPRFKSKYGYMVRIYLRPQPPAHGNSAGPYINIRP